MDTYTLVKTIHILSATILFGTGIGTAFFFWSARHGDDAARLYAARTTVRADFLFTLPAVIIQPASGAWMIVRAGYDPGALWLSATVLLYLLVGACWIPVVWIQARMARMTPNPAQVKLDKLYLQRISENSMSAVQETVFGIIAKEAGIDIATIKPDSTLKDLNIQSLDAVQIIFEIEDHYKITLPDRDPNFDTESVKGLIDAVEKLVAEKAVAPSAG